MNVVLTGSDVDIVQKALEMYIALHLGRYGDISTLYRFCCESDQYEEAIAYEQGRENILLLIRNRLMPELAMFSLNAANRGIYQEIVDDKARDAYDLLQVIRYADTWYRQPGGGTGLGFMKPMFSGRYDAPSCEAAEKEGAEVLTVALCKEQLEIMKEAATVYSQVLHGHMRQVWDCYTTDEEVLAMAEEMEPMFPHVIRKELIEQADSFRNYLCGL